MPDAPPGVAVFVEDDALRRAVSASLRAHGVLVRSARTAAEFAKQLTDGAVHVVVTTAQDRSTLAGTSSLPLIHIAPADTVDDVVARALAVLR